MNELSLEKFEEAYELLERVVLPTNLIYSEYFSQSTGNRVYFKPENLQQTGEIGTKLAQLINDVTLYKALGGGWHQGDDASAKEIRKKL